MFRAISAVGHRRRFRMRAARDLFSPGEGGAQAPIFGAPVALALFRPSVSCARAGDGRVRCAVSHLPFPIAQTEPVRRDCSSPKGFRFRVETQI